MQARTSSPRDRLAQAERRAAELAMVAEVAGELARSLDLSVVSAIIARLALELTGAAECSLWLASSEGVEQLAVATGGRANRSPSAEQRTLLRRHVLATGEPLVITEDEGDREGDYVALPMALPTGLLALVELVGFPLPEYAEEQVATLRQALPIAALSLQNALTTKENVAVSARLREALDDLQIRQVTLEAQNEEIAAQSDELRSQNEEIQLQNEEIQTQRDELQMQNEQLAEQQQELEERNRAVARANVELTDQEARTRAIVEATADGLMVVDGNHRVVAVNPALEALTGYSADELVGHHCTHLLEARRPDQECICDASCPFLYEHGDGPANVDAVLIAKDGSERWVNIAYGVIGGSDGRPSTVVHAIRDVSARKELERQKDEFLSIVAHDLKNPLAAIRGHSQILVHRLRRKGGDEELLKPIEAVDGQVGRMVALIDELLDLTRLQMGRFELRPEPVDLAALARNVVAEAQVTADQHRISLDVGDWSPVGMWDRDCVERVLANLVQNAVKYSPGGEISVAVRGAIRGEPNVDGRQGGLQPCSDPSAAAWAMVSVTDRGPGIAPEDQARLFERYYRTDSARKGAKGLGLGLFICRGLVEAHDGLIWVESELGRGATFAFALPLTPSKA